MNESAGADANGDDGDDDASYAEAWSSRWGSRNYCCYSCILGHLTSVSMDYDV